MLITRRAGLARIFLGGGALLFGSRAALAESVQYTYDALGRIVGVTYSDGSTITYAYDALGNRTTVAQTTPGGPPYPPFNMTIPIIGSGPVNLRTLADSAGYNGVQNASLIFTLASGALITGAAGAPNGGAGIDSGTWPTSSYTISLQLQISGTVYGGGGRGGQGADGASNGGTGGDAIYCRLPMVIVVNSGGQVVSGGGGGGGGGGWIKASPMTDRAGGGGGGGFPNGPGGPFGSHDYGTGAQNGSTGTTAGGGAGGVGDTTVSSHGGGAGGTGGGAAASGANGALGDGSTASGWARLNNSNGGAPGYAIRKNSNTVTVTNNGTISGTVG